MPNKDRLRLWVAALRDPNLVQGHGCLAQRRSEDEPWQQCCLGVACEVAIAKGLPLLRKTVENRMRGFVRAYAVEGAESFDTLVLPPAVLEWYGLPQRIREVDLGTDLAVELNDESRLTFAEIADIIEEHFQLNED